MAEIVYRQMPAPRDIPQKIPAPRAKIRMQKPQSGGEFSVQIHGGARGGMVMAKIDNCITREVTISFQLEAIFERWSPTEGCKWSIWLLSRHVPSPSRRYSRQI